MTTNLKAQDFGFKAAGLFKFFAKMIKRFRVLDESLGQSYARDKKWA